MATKTKTAKTTKGATVLTMIAAAKGATTAALMKATDWQAHTLRAFLSRSREANGITSERLDGTTTYYGKTKPAKAKRAAAKKPAKAKAAKPAETPAAAGA